MAQISVMVKGQAGEQDSCRAESGALCEPQNLCLVLTTPEHFLKKKLSPCFLHYICIWFWFGFFSVSFGGFVVVVVDL